MANILRNLETYHKADELMAVCRKAVKKAQAESRRQGVPNVYFLDGHLYYELPNGDYSRTAPDDTWPNGA